MRLVLPFIITAILAGCRADSAPATPKSTRKDRMQAAEERLAKTPIPRTYRYQDGELRVLQAPVADGFGFVEQQQCFIWRDLEFKTSAISCSVPPDVTPSAGQP